MRLAAALSFALLGCSAVIGADFDRPEASATKDVLGGGRLGPIESTVPVDADGQCPSARKRCGDACALEDDPAFGCGTCSPCAAPRDAVATCDAQLRCDFACERGFERVGDRCVGFRLERDDMPELLAVIGRSEHEVYVAGGTPYEPARIFRGSGSSWTPLESGASNNRLVFGFSRSYTNELFLASESTSFPGSPQDSDTVFRLDTAGRWHSVRVGEPPPRATYDVAVTDAGIFAASGPSVRRLAGGTWAEETTGLAGGRFFVTTAEGKGLLLIDTSGAIAERNSDGSWRRRFTPDDELRINAVWMSPTTNELYLVGDDGLIMVSQNARDFTRLRADTTEGLFGFWGSGDDRWAVGAHGTILHAGSDQHFVAVPSGTTEFLRGIWGTSPTNIYVVGLVSTEHRGFILHRF